MWSFFRHKRRSDEQRTHEEAQNPPAKSRDEFAMGYSQILELFHKQLEGCSDLVERPFNFRSGEQATLFFIDGLVNQNLMQRDLLPTLLASPLKTLSDPYSSIPISNLKRETKIDATISVLFSGFVVLIVEGWSYALAFEIKGWEQRTIQEPDTEKNVRGPHEGFIENIRVNTAILRRKLRTPQLKFKELTVGKRSPTAIIIAYIEGIANPELVQRLEKRIEEIDIDVVQSEGYIEQLTLENPWSPFPQYQMTERPEKAVGNLLEGRLLVLTDGTPSVLIAPVDFFQFFQSMDDYSSNWITASIIRFSRIAAVFLAIFLSSFYIAVLSFHYEAIPLKLLLQLAETRAKVPFPPVIEAFFMESIIELIREAVIRLPSFIGQVIGVVGGIVIGQAVVSAGLIGNVMIVIVSLSAIANYVIPSYDMGLSIRFIRFPIMILAAIFGIIGLLIGGAILLTHLLSLESLGQPYFTPLVPLHAKNMKDTFIRAPLEMQGPRPKSNWPGDKFRGKGRKRG